MMNSSSFYRKYRSHTAQYEREFIDDLWRLVKENRRVYPPGRLFIAEAALDFMNEWSEYNYWPSSKGLTPDNITPARPGVTFGVAGDIGYPLGLCG